MARSSYAAFDCDDTLVRWIGGQEPHPFGYGAERWEFNLDVVAGMRRWLDAGRGVLVWSGGGMEYARMWVTRLELACHLGPDEVTCGQKDPQLLRLCVLYVDDQELFGGRAVTGDGSQVPWYKPDMVGFPL